MKTGSLGGGRYGFSGAQRGGRLRECPKCAARPGHACGRWTPMGTWQILKKLHPERTGRAR